MAATLRTFTPRRDNLNDCLTVYIDQHDDGYIVMKQDNEWISVPQEDLPGLISSLQTVADMVLK